MCSDENKQKCTEIVLRPEPHSSIYDQNVGQGTCFIVVWYAPMSAAADT